MQSLFNFWSRQQRVLVALLLALLPVSAVWADDYAEVSAMLRAGQLNEAQVKADQYLAGKPKDPQMRFLKGVVLTEKGRLGEAIAVFTKLTEDYPELPEPYNNLAVVYASQSQYDKARSILETAIRTNPSYSTAHENLGDVYAKLASQAYGKALQLDGSNAAVPPKLALIKEIFMPKSRVATAAASAAAAPPSSPVAAAPAPPPPGVSVLKGAGVKSAETAPAPSSGNKAAERSDDAETRQKVEEAVRAWAAAWAAKDVKRYLSFYGSAFEPPARMLRSQWEEERRQRIESKARIHVRLSQLRVEVNGRNASVKFRQEYRADSLTANSRKSLELLRVGDRWLIVKETAA